MAEVGLYLAGFVIAALIALAFLFWVRKTEIYEREPWSSVLLAFVLGGAIVTLAAAAVSIIFQIPPRDFGDFLPFDATVQGAVVAIIVAPVLEEGAKALAMFLMRRRLVEVENGIVYGASVGLGFAMVENVLYFYGAVNAGGAEGLALMAIARAFSTTVMHMATGALIGYGMALYLRPSGEGARKAWWPYLLAAIAVHAVFNSLASVQMFIPDDMTKMFVTIVFGVLIGGVLAWYVFLQLHKRLKQLDLEGEAQREIEEEQKA